MSETETIADEERKSIPDFPSYLITRSGLIYSARHARRDLIRQSGPLEESNVYIQHPGDDEVSVKHNVAKLVKKTFDA